MTVEDYDGNVLSVATRLELPTTMQVAHTQCLTTPVDMNAKIAAFWNTWWQRDKAAEVLEDTNWTDVLSLIKFEIPQHPEHEIHASEEEIWNICLQKTKKNTARGACGFSRND